MKIIITLAILASFALNGVAQTNIIQIPVGDLGLVAQGGVKVQVQLLSPLPRIVNGVGVRPDPMAHFTDTNGVAAFTNLVWGNYGAQVFGQPGIPFKFTVQTNTVGTVNVFKLVGFTNIPPAPWPYYTASQIDLFLAGLLTNGQEVVTFGGATFIKTNFDAGQAGTLVSRLPNGNFVVGSSNRLAIVNTNSAFGSNVFCSILGGALNEMIYDGGTPGGRIIR